MSDGVDGILGSVPSVSGLVESTSDDWIDRVSHIYTCMLLVIFSVVVSTGQFVGDPIHCWCPAEFTDSYEDYTKYICWISNTYYIPISETIPLEVEQRDEREITYYQWVPLILLFQAFMFKIPNVLWRLSNPQSGVNIDKLIKIAQDTQTGSPEERQETIENVAKYLDKWLVTYQQRSKNILIRVQAQAFKLLCCLCNKRTGSYLTGLYLFVKLVYLANAISQFFILNAFMATDYNLYGFEFIDKVIKNEPVRESPRFPRVTLCDFRIRQLQNVQPWTVQCVLPVNLFNEKIFMFLWFWFVIVSTLAAVSFIHWVVYYVFKQNKVRYVKKYLKINHQLHNSFDKKLCVRFAENYLRNDGMFVLFMIAKNSTDMVVTDLIKEMWKLYKAKYGPNNNMNDTENNERPNDAKSLEDIPQ